jgi:hypothetical protein
MASLLVGLSPSELSRVERGQRRLSGAARAAYIRTYDLGVDDVRMIRELDPAYQESRV